MKKALLIIDIQNDYFDGGNMSLVGSLEASKNAKKVLEKSRNQGISIIHIQHISVRPGATFFLPDTKGAMIQDNVKPLESEKVIIKHYPNSFRETELLNYLEENKITDLTIMGMMTHMCVDATTRAAKDYGFNCTLIGDACASFDLEINGQKTKAADVHNAFLSALSYFYAQVVTTKDYLEEAK